MPQYGFGAPPGTGGIGGNFGGAFGNSFGNFTPNANLAYQWGGPTGPGMYDAAGAYINQAAAFKPPVYTNSMGGGDWGTPSSPVAGSPYTNTMSPGSWDKIAAGVRASQPTQAASSGSAPSTGGWQFPGGSAGAALMGMQAYYGGGGSAGGGGATGGYGGPGISPSYFDQFSPMGSNAGAMGGGMGYPGQGQGNVNYPLGSATQSRLGQLVSGAESRYGATAADQPPTMANQYYGQYPAFVQQYGGVQGEPAVTNYANAILKSRPDATLGDYYGGYFSGGPPSAASPALYNRWGQSGAQAQQNWGGVLAANNLSPSTPLSSVMGQRVGATTYPTQAIPGAGGVTPWQVAQAGGMTLNNSGRF
ncbi:MAG TPA: hypothetical protein VGG68_00055 [Caulobacteraceae bacterium]|jgi:hypothetical protein